MKTGRAIVWAALGAALGTPPATAQGPGIPPASARPRARELGVAPGVFAPGPLNAITDVTGVRVGHATIVLGDSVRTGVTAILAHDRNPYFERVPAAVHVGNGFGKLLGATQVAELGELETPILLTCTLCVWRAGDALVEWMLEQPGMEAVTSLNPVVGETNDRRLNDIRSRPVRREDVRHAIEVATSGPVDEGAVGAGTGTVAFEWKGASAPRPVCFRPRLADTPRGFWSSRISGASCRCSARQSARSSGGIRFAIRRRGTAATVPS